MTVSLSHRSQPHLGSIDAVIRDVDLPFLRLSTLEPLALNGQSIDFTLCGHGFRAWVLPVRGDDSGDTVWVRIDEPENLTSVIERLFLQDRADATTTERRNDSRIRTLLNVRSPDLPQCRATTYDVSETGLRLVTEGAIPDGTRLRLQVEDSVGLANVWGETVWSNARLNSLFHVGVRLLPHTN